jgi:glutamine cyclotransferase
MSAMKQQSSRYAIALLILFGAACEAKTPPREPPVANAKPSSAAAYTVEVIRRLPHDPSAYTQGLIFRDGYLFESTGRYGRSQLRKIDPVSGSVLTSVKLENNVFAEGLAATRTHLVQLSWKEMEAYYYDPETLERRKTVAYDGEGWGLCFDGNSFYMTSGDDQLIQRNAETFAPTSSMPITLDGEPIPRANELECVGDVIWANVYLTNRILQIDKHTGVVKGEIDATSVVPAGMGRDADHVLNGIAWNDRTDTYYLTGKLWPVMLEVRLKAK